jgi:hypothetical protein
MRDILLVFFQIRFCPEDSLSIKVNFEIKRAYQPCFMEADHTSALRLAVRQGLIHCRHCLSVARQITDSGG